MLRKKIVAGVLVGALAVFGAFGLAACGGGSSNELGLIEDGKLIVATSPDYEPFENLEGDEYVGLEVDLIRAVGEQMGLEIEFKNMQFDAIIPAIVAGGQADIGMSGFSVTPERAEEIDFTTSYFTDDMGVLVMSGGSVTEENAADALNQSDVIFAVQSGTTGEDYAKETFPNAQIKGYGNANDTFAALQAGEADAVCTNLSVANTMLKSYTEATVVMKIATGEDYAMVVSKENPELLEAINAALAELETSGKIKEIFG